MEEVILKAIVRTETGKQANKKLHTKGSLPAVVYKKGEGALSVVLAEHDIMKALHTKAGENVIITLKIEDPSSKKGQDKTVIVKEIQYHPVKRSILHVDFNQISLTQVIKVNVPLIAKGDAVGVKDGGVLEHILWELEVECLPREIPEKIELDVSALKVNDALYVKDIKAPKGIKVLNDPELIVISVKPQVIEKPAGEVVAEAGTEPEVTKQKKPEEIEAEAATADKKGKEEKAK